MIALYEIMYLKVSLTFNGCPVYMLREACQESEMTWDKCMEAGTLTRQWTKNQEEASINAKPSEAAYFKLHILYNGQLIILTDYPHWLMWWNCLKV